MTAWWNDLSQRERTLILVAGGLAGLLFLSLMVVRPMMGWREDASRRAEQARDGYEMVAAAAAVGAKAADPAPQASTPLRQAITASAVASGIELARIGAEANGQIEVQPEPVSGDVLFAWLRQLEMRFGVSVVFADMAGADDGAINAQVLVFERKQ